MKWPCVLASLKPTKDVGQQTRQAVEDWHYWLKQGYCFLNLPVLFTHPKPSCSFLSLRGQLLAGLAI